MSVVVKPLPELVKELPPDIQIEVRDFVEFLLEKRERTSKKKKRKRRLGSLKDSITIIGDIIAPACDESDWEVLQS
jgi:hypothetical protein